MPCSAASRATAGEWRRLGASPGAGADAVAGVTGSPCARNSARGVPTGTVSPSATRTAASVPSNGDGISTVTFSVSISTIGSSSATVAPGTTSQRRIVPSVTDSPSWGIVSVAIGVLPARAQ